MPAKQNYKLTAAKIAPTPTKSAPIFTATLFGPAPVIAVLEAAVPVAVPDVLADPDVLLADVVAVVCCATAADPVLFTEAAEVVFVDNVVVGSAVIDIVLPPTVTCAPVAVAS